MASFYTNKTVVVTGGTDGIGKALVMALLKQGANVATCGRNSLKFEQLKQECNHTKLLCITADVSVENDCRELIKATVHQFGTIDILINNAGISMRSLFEDCDTSVIKKLMDINFMGAVYCTKEALSFIIKQKGVVVGISSIAGYRGLPGRSGYSASKFALNGWLESIKTELSPQGVHVMWVAPGFTRSNIRNTALNAIAKEQGESPLDESSLMSAETCAAHILRAIKKRKRNLVLTAQGKLAIWLNKFFAVLTDMLIRKFYFKEGKLLK